MELVRTWNRLHRNGLLATVDRFTTSDGDIFTAGAHPLYGGGMLRFGLADLRAAMDYADAEARKDGHTCDAACGAWATSADENSREAV